MNPPRRPDGRPIRNILLVQLGDIGDVVLSTPCVAALNAAFPTSSLTMAVRAKAAELLRLVTGVDRVEPVATGKPLAVLGQLWRLRRGGFDLALDLRNGERGAVLVAASGAPLRLGVDDGANPAWRRWLFTRLVPDRYTPPQHVSDYLLDLLAAHGIGASDRRPHLQIPATVAREAQEILQAAGIANPTNLAALHPFSLWPYKELSPATYLAVIHHLRDTHGYTVVICGGPAEEERGQRLATQAGSGVINLAGRTTLAQYGAILARCRILVGIDSVGQHLAGGLDVPSLTVYGPSHPASWAPRGPRHRVVQPAGFSCLPCRDTGCQGSGRSRCLETMPVETLLTALDHHLETVAP